MAVAADMLLLFPIRKWLVDLVIERFRKQGGRVEKVSLSLKEIQLTLLAPLWGRAWEAKQTRSLLVDMPALEMIDHIDFDFSKWETVYDDFLRLIWTARAYQFDRVVDDFIHRFPQGIVVNIGCGLDTGYARINRRPMRWYELDFPDVLALKQTLTPSGVQPVYLPFSVFDSQWFDRIDRDRPVLFMASGVFYYYPFQQVLTLFDQMRQIFPYGELVQDIVSPIGKWATNKYVLEKNQLNSKSYLLWGLTRQKVGAAWGPGFRMIDDLSLFRHIELKKRNLSLKARIRLHLFERLRIGRILHMAFTQENFFGHRLCRFNKGECHNRRPLAVMSATSINPL